MCFTTIILWTRWRAAPSFISARLLIAQKEYEEAVKDYDLVLEQFSGNTKAATAQLHKGLALIAMASGMRARMSCARLSSATHRPGSGPGASQAERDGRAGLRRPLISDFRQNEVDPGLRAPSKSANIYICRSVPFLLRPPSDSSI